MTARCDVSRATITQLESGDASVSADILLRDLMVSGKNGNIDKLLAEHQLGCELATAKKLRRTFSPHKRGCQVRILDGDDRTASDQDARPTQVVVKSRLSTAVKRVRIHVPLTTTNVEKKRWLVNVARNRPATEVKK